jgi:hypothetical protein
MMRRSLWALWLLLPPQAWAQSIEYRGFADVRGMLFPQAAPGDSGRAIADILIRAEAAAKLTPWLRINGTVDARTDTHRQTERSFRLDWQDRRAQRPLLSLRRLSATAYRGPVTFEIGKQFIRWGKADILNPIDRFAPRDFLNVVDNDFLGVLAARLTIERGRHTLDAVVQPRFTPSRTPLLNQRWVAAPVALVRGQAYLPGGVQTGLRWNYLGDGYEMSLAYYEGHNHLPVLDGAFVNGRVRVDYRFPHMRMVGGAGAVPLRWFTVKGEAAYYASKDSFADNYALYVLQLERTVGEWTFVGGYAGEVVTNRRTLVNFAPDRGLARAFVARASYSIDSDRSIAGEAAIRENGAGIWLKSEYIESLSAHWQARVSLTLIRGRSDDFLGQYQKNSHVIVGMRYSW